MFSNVTLNVTLLSAPDHCFQQYANSSSTSSPQFVSWVPSDDAWSNISNQRARKSDFEKQFSKPENEDLSLDTILSPSTSSSSSPATSFLVSVSSWNTHFASVGIVPGDFVHLEWTGDNGDSSQTRSHRIGRIWPNDSPFTIGSTPQSSGNSGSVSDNRKRTPTGNRVHGSTSSSVASSNSSLTPAASPMKEATASPHSVSTPKPNHSVSLNLNGSTFSIFCLRSVFNGNGKNGTPAKLYFVPSPTSSSLKSSFPTTPYWSDVSLCFPRTVLEQQRKFLLSTTIFQLNRLKDSHSHSLCFCTCFPHWESIRNDICNWEIVGRSSFVRIRGLSGSWYPSLLICQSSEFATESPSPSVISGGVSTPTRSDIIDFPRTAPSRSTPPYGYLKGSSSSSVRFHLVFCSDRDWNELCEGVKKDQDKLMSNDIPSASSESPCFSNLCSKVNEIAGLRIVETNLIRRILHWCQWTLNLSLRLSLQATGLGYVESVPSLLVYSSTRNEWGRSARSRSATGGFGEGSSARSSDGLRAAVRYVAKKLGLTVIRIRGSILFPPSDSHNPTPSSSAAAPESSSVSSSLSVSVFSSSSFSMDCDFEMSSMTHFLQSITQGSHSIGDAFRLVAQGLRHASSLSSKSGGGCKVLVVLEDLDLLCPPSKPQDEIGGGIEDSRRSIFLLEIHRGFEMLQQTCPPGSVAVIGFVGSHSGQVVDSPQVDHLHSNHDSIRESGLESQMPFVSCTGNIQERGSTLSFIDKSIVGLFSDHLEIPSLEPEEKISILHSILDRCHSRGDFEVPPPFLQSLKKFFISASSVSTSTLTAGDQQQQQQQHYLKSVFEINSFVSALGMVASHRCSSSRNASGTISLIAEDIEAAFLRLSRSDLAVTLISNRMNNGNVSPSLQDWNRIVGLKEAKDLMWQYSLSVFDPVVSAGWKRMRISPPCGILLFGPPGTGKTLLARSLAAACQSQLFLLSLADAVDEYRGRDAADRITRIFDEAFRVKRALIVIDEAQAAVGDRSSSESGGGGAGSKAVWWALCQCLDRLWHLSQAHVSVNQSSTDGNGKNSSSSSSSVQVMVIAMTNVPEVMDSSLLSASRLGRLVYVGLPSSEERRLLLFSFLTELPMDLVFQKTVHCWYHHHKPQDATTTSDQEVLLEGVNQLSVLETRLVRFSAADLKNLCRRAALVGLNRLSSEFLFWEKGVILEDVLLAAKRTEASTTRSMELHYLKWQRKLCYQERKM